MMNTVRNRARPISTWLGGACCSDSARLMKSKTIAMRRKHVVRIRMDGAMASTVSRSSICTESTTSWLLRAWRTFRSTKGKPSPPAAGAAPEACADRGTRPAPSSRTTAT